MTVRTPWRKISKSVRPSSSFPFLAELHVDPEVSMPKTISTAVESDVESSYNMLNILKVPSDSETKRMGEDTDI